jgi:TonB-linked SusC/RagA family outer membrane protein
MINKLIIASLFLLVLNGAYAQQKLSISGRITDAATKKGIVAIGVSVGEFSAAITDEEGKFTLDVPSYDADVLVSGAGYATRVISLKGKQTLNVELLDDSHTSFQEVVVIPTGTTFQRNTPYAINRYSLPEKWVRPDETVDALLQGHIPGLNSIRRSGAPGVGANLFLRGYNSLYATNKPLIVVDGMIFDASDYGESIIANNYTNPLALINVQDIDNVTVLKDASSIYGTKGANGAIIITSARAKEEVTKIDFTASTGISRVPHRLPVMNANNYRIYLSEILQSKGMSPGDIAALPYMDDDPSNPQYYRYHNNTDWQKDVMDAAINNSYFLKVTGGDNIATYALSVGYTKNKGIVRETDLTRYNTRFNAQFNFSKKFTGAANLSFTYNEQKLKDQGISDKTTPIFVSLVKAPFMTENEVNDKGVRSPNLEDADVLGISNPVALIRTMQASNKYYRFSGTFTFSYEFTKNLRASTLFGIVNDKVRETIFIPRKGVANDTLSNAVADSRLGSQVKRLFSVYSDSYLEFNKTFNSVHKFTSRLGLRYQHNRAEQDSVTTANSATDELISVQNGLAALRQVGGNIGVWNWMNTYLNVQYGFRNKYFVALNAAMDGSSRFGTETKEGITFGGARFAIMPSISAAWLVSSESFMKGSSVDLLKIRATYSMTGNDDIGNYSTRQTYGFSNLLGMQGLVRNGITNPSLQWETSKKANIGFDMALLNEKVTLSFDVFNAKTTNMLVYQELPAPTGFSTILTNDGSMRNTGYEAGLNVRAINKKDLRLDLGLNIGHYENEILSVPGDRFTTQYADATILTSEGQPANLFFGYKTNGVFSTTAEATAANLNKRNADGSLTQFGAGDMRFVDVNNDHIIDETDRQVIGDPNPDFFGGITARVAYKRFELNTLLTFSKGNDVFNYLRYRLESASGVENQLNSVTNRWRTEGHVTNTPKATWRDPMGNSRFSDRWIEDGSYLRLRSVCLSYNIPVKAGFMKNASVSLSANNLLTFTKYMGFDPEFSANTTVFAQGIDTGLDPIYKTITLGVRIGL